MSGFVVDVDVPVPMRDGNQLATNVWRPSSDGPFPGLLLRTPYGKDSMALYGNTKLPDVLALVEAGYVIVAQDIRGTSRSPGTFVPHGDSTDGVDTVAWMRAQPWCDGNIGTWGGSYMGFTQWQTAALNPPGLRAMAPVMTSADPYRAPWYSDGGALSLSTFRAWSARMTDAESDTPVRRWVNDVLDHPDRDAYWRDLAAMEHCASITVPALNIGGWYDVFIGQTVRSYTTMRRHGGSVAAREGQRLVVGPWGHPDGADLGTFPARSFGAAGDIRSAGITEEHVRFFDRWVRGLDAAEPRERVRIFVMGTDRWRDEDDWPLPDTRYTDYFLSDAGSLSVDGPETDAHDTYRYDPRDPVPTLGGTILADGGFCGPADQSSVEERDDVLCFTTPVLTEPVEATGHVTVTLFVSSSAVDTDFTGKLVDVHPDGRAILLCEGVRRARYRRSLADPRPLRPGEVSELVMDVGVTSNVFLPGHRIRLEVSSSNFPRYDRNPNTGAYDSEGMVVAVNKVFHGPAWPSRLVLPVIDRERDHV